MQSDPRVGIELPLRILVWQEDEGAVLGYNDPRELASQFDVREHAETLGTMSALLAALVADAAR